MGRAMTIRTSINNFLDDFRVDHSAGTIDDYDFSLTLFERFCRARNITTVSQLDAALIYDFYIDLNRRSRLTNQRGEGSLTPRYIRKTFSAIKQYCMFLERMDLIKENLLKKIRVTRTKKSKKPLAEEIKYLLKEELEEIFVKAKLRSLRDYFMLKLLFLSGLRADAFLSLRRKDVFDKGIAWGASKKYIAYLVPEFWQEFLEWIAPLRKSDPLFKNNRDEPLGYDGFHKICRGYGFHPHMLRHSLGVELRRQGKDLDEIAEVLDHARLDTARLYARIVDIEGIYRKSNEKR